MEASGGVTVDMHHAQAAAFEGWDAELNRLFLELDNLTDVRVAVDRTTGWPRGFAHADFTDVESAVTAYNKLNGSTIGGRELRFDWAETSGSYGRKGTVPPESTAKTY